MDSSSERPAKSAIGCLAAAHGLYLVVAGVALGVFAWLIPMLMVKIVASDVVDPQSVPRIARIAIDNRGLMPVVALPAIVFGVMGLCKVRPHWLWASLGLLALLLPGLLLMYAFLATIAQLYQFNEL